MRAVTILAVLLTAAAAHAQNAALTAPDPNAAPPDEIPEDKPTTPSITNDEGIPNLSESLSEQALHYWGTQRYNNTDFHFANHQDQWVTPRPKGLIFGQNCFRQYFKCLLSVSAPEPVCAYNNPYNPYVGFRTAPTYCDIYFDNCRRGYRVWRIFDTGICEFQHNNPDSDHVAKDVGYKPGYSPLGYP